MSTKELLFTGLLDLAGTDSSDIKGQVRQLTPEGIYIVLMDEAGLESGEAANGNPWVQCRFKGQTCEFLSLDSTEEGANDLRERIVGRSFTTSTFLDVENLRESIALLKGRIYDKVGIDTSGPVGGVEGVPGWIDRMVNKLVAIKVEHKNKKDGTPTDRFTWLEPDSLEAYGIVWDEVRASFEPAGDYNGADAGADAAA